MSGQDVLEWRNRQFERLHKVCSLICTYSLSMNNHWGVSALLVSEAPAATSWPREMRPCATEQRSRSAIIGRLYGMSRSGDSSASDGRRRCRYERLRRVSNGHRLLLDDQCSSLSHFYKSKLTVEKLLWSFEYKSLPNNDCKDPNISPILYYRRRPARRSRSSSLLLPPPVCRVACGRESRYSWAISMLMESRKHTNRLLIFLYWVGAKVPAAF